MMKRLTAALAAAMMLANVSAHAAGTIPLAMAQQVDVNGAPLANCQLSFFVAGTISTPQNAYSDFGLTQALPNPLSCDQAGRIPMFWLADGLIHVRLTDASGGGGISGGPIFDTTMQVLGPSSGGGGGGSTVDPTTILATGDEKIRYGTGALAGFVRENGLTIGNATSGATERANADTQSLFIYLYNINPNLLVSGGRTGNALNDYNSSKQLTLPDMRGAAAAGLDDMGNSAKGVFAGVTFTSGNATTLDSLVGAARRTLGLGNVPAITSSNASQSISVSGGGSVSASGSNSISVSGSPTITVYPGGNTNAYVPATTIATSWLYTNASPTSCTTNCFPYVGVGAGATSANPFSGTNNISLSGSNPISVSGTASVTASGSNSISVTSTGTLGSAFDSVSPYALRTFYIKL